MRRPAIIPILVFLVASALASALASPLLAVLQGVMSLNPNILRLTVFSTAVGAAVAFLIWRRSLAYPPVAVTMLSWPVLFGVGAFLLAGVLAFALAKIEHAPWRAPRPGDLGAPLVIILAVQLIGAAAEEVGWRGLVQPLLETRLAIWKAALVTGALFALGHFYLAFMVSPASFLLFIVSAIAISLVLAVATVGQSWASRIAVASLLHFLVNMETFFLFADGDGSVLYFADLALAFGAVGVVALVVLWRRADRFAYPSRRRRCPLRGMTPSGAIDPSATLGMSAGRQIGRACRRFPSVHDAPTQLSSAAISRRLAILALRPANASNARSCAIREFGLVRTL